MSFRVLSRVLLSSSLALGLSVGAALAANSDLGDNDVLEDHLDQAKVAKKSPRAPKNAW